MCMRTQYNIRVMPQSGVNKWRRNIKISMLWYVYNGEPQFAVRTFFYRRKKQQIHYVEVDMNRLFGVEE